MRGMFEKETTSCASCEHNGRDERVSATATQHLACWVLGIRHSTSLKALQTTGAGPGAFWARVEAKLGNR